MLVVLLAVPWRAQFETSKAVERGGTAVRQIAGEGGQGEIGAARWGQIPEIFEGEPVLCSLRCAPDRARSCYRDNRRISIRTERVGEPQEQQRNPQGRKPSEEGALISEPKLRPPKGKEEEVK